MSIDTPDMEDLITHQTNQTEIAHFHNIAVRQQHVSKG